MLLFIIKKSVQLLERNITKKSPINMIMEYEKLNEWSSVKVCTKDDREFVISEPFYDKVNNTISGHVHEVTKNKSNAPYSTQFPIAEIKNIECLSTKKQSQKLDKLVTKIIIIVFVVAALVAYVRECT